MEQEEEGKKRDGRRGGEGGRESEEGVEKKIKGRVERTSGILTLVSPLPY